MTPFHKASRPCAIFITAAAMMTAAGAARPVFAEEQVKLTHKQLSRTTSALDAAVVTEASKLESTAIASLRTRDSSVVRLESAWTFLPENSRTQLKLGDSTSDAGQWGSAVRFAGVQFGTGLQMRDDVLFAPRLALAGTGIVPTVADAMLGTANAPSAGFAERGLSTGRISANASGLSFTARDAAGRSTAVSRSLVAKARGVDDGCRAYSLSVGRVRENYGLQESNYGPWFANTTIACGIGGGRAFEAHGEHLAGDATLAGVSLTQPIGNATASIAAATSDNTKGQGWAMQMGLQRDLSRVAVGLQAQVQTPEYRELGRAELEDAISQRMLASIATRFGDRSMLALAYAMQRTSDQTRTDVVGLTQTLRFRTGGSVSLGANHSVNDQKYSSVNLSFARALSY
jgi:outer membrane usher protein